MIGTRPARSPARCRPLLAALIAAAGLAGCGEDRQPDPAARRPAAPAAVRPLAGVRTEWTGVSIEVVEATRSGGTLLVRFRFVNASAQPFEFGNRFAADPGDRDTIADAVLTDPSGLRRYFVLRDRENRPLCSSGLAPLQPGEARLLFARFPSPARGPSRITIHIPHAADIGEVPVGGADGRSGTGS